MKENIVNWDFMGWKKTIEPDVGVQLNWNKPLNIKNSPTNALVSGNAILANEKATNNIANVGCFLASPPKSFMDLVPV